MLVIYDRSPPRSSFPSAAEAGSSVPAPYVSFPAPHHSFSRKSRCLCRISHLWSLLGQKLPSPPQIHQRSQGVCNSKWNEYECIRREGGAVNLGLWFLVVGKHDGSEQSCWKSPHLPQDGCHRQTRMQEGSCISTARLCMYTVCARYVHGAAPLASGQEKPGLLSQTLGEGLSTK